MHPHYKYCCCSISKLCLTLCNSINCSMPGFAVLYYLPEGMVKQGIMSYCVCALYLLLSILGILCSNSCPSSQWYHLTISSSVTPFSSCPQSFPSIRVFFNELSLCIRWPKYWSFSFSITPSNEHSWLISFRINWLDLLTYHGTLKSILQL